MFWGCFIYDKKGPYYVYKLETKVEKEVAAQKISKLNAKLETQMREDQELNIGIRRIGLRYKPSKKPQQKQNKKNSKLVRFLGGGINQQRYQTYILLPKLLPFIKEYIKDRLQTIVIEDKVPTYAHYYQDVVYSLEKVKKLL